ncbi:MAG TPA: mechanosensitive ion channel domain-containing protein, partial [Rhodocyclaceae bacterium]
VPGLGQETVETAEPAPPDLVALDEDWWSYFEGAAEDVGPRIEGLLTLVNEQIAGLGAQNQETAPPVLQAVRDNLQVYLSLLDGAQSEPPALDEPAAAYSLDELLDLAAEARAAREAADAAVSEVERERRVFNGASRRRDAMFKDYLDAAEGDDRWLAGLRLVRARSAQAISARRLAILTQSASFAEDNADQLEARVDLVRERLATTADQEAIDGLIETVAERAAAVEAAEETAREAQIAASGLDVNTAEGRSEQRLQQQRALDAEIEHSQARLALAAAEARRFWTELGLETPPDFSVVEDKSLEWSELVRDVRVNLVVWKQQTEDELLAVQRVDRDELDRAARRLLDQRIGTAQETLGHIGELESAAADLDLLMAAVDDSLASYAGTFEQWLSNLDRAVRTAWIRISEFSGTTLFSVGETPVTFGDIVQAIVIFIVGLLLSRSIRFAIRRVGSKESPGTQASLYTLSRLTHYTIVILAVLIALTSIGLDFTNLALVAGALSVGIGFGLQSIVNNFVSGLIILFERSLRVGDYIELDNGLTGTVKAINVRSTLINTNDNIDIVVPNSEFVSTKLTNWTLAEHILRVRIPFGVAYGSDKELVRKAAIEACDDVPYTLTHMRGREPDVWLVEYGDSSLNFLLLVWVNRQGARRPTRTRAAYLWALETKLAEYGIEIPFPQRDLHLRSGWPAAQD